MARWAVAGCLAMGTGLASAAPASDSLPQSSQVTLQSGPTIELPEYVTLVPVGGVVNLCVSEPARKLVLARGKAKQQVILLPLDEAGQPVAGATPQGITFPPNGQRASLADHALAVAAHPSLPVIYVWRDLANQPNTVSRVNSTNREYEHLLIYDISGDQPRLLFTGCKGEDYQVGRNDGLLTLSPTGNRLFLPNLVYIAGRHRRVALGMLRLDDQGLPILKNPEPQAQVELVGPTEAEAEAEVETDADVPPNRENGLTLIALNEVGYRMSDSLVHQVDQSHVLLLTGNFLVGYNFANRASRIAAAAIPHASAAFTAMSVHPSLGMAYIVLKNQSRVIAWAHFKGYPSLQPQVVHLPGRAVLTAPAVMASRQKLAVGSGYGLMLLDLDDHGWVKPAVTLISLRNPKVTQLTYSPRFDRLYVISPLDPEDKP